MHLHTSSFSCHLHHCNASLCVLHCITCINKCTLNVLSMCKSCPSIHCYLPKPVAMETISHKLHTFHISTINSGINGVLYTNTYARTHTYIYIHVHIHTHTCTQRHTDIHVQMHTTYTHAHMDTSNARTHAHAHTHTSICTYSKSRQCLC